jgi:4-hydroxybenzoate polyprenyltransferase
MRPYLLFVSGAAGLAGISIAPDAGMDIQVFLMTFIPLFLGYGFGQALTDCFQTDTDSISAPYRPLVQGIISVKSVLIVSVSGLVLITISLIYLNLNNILFGLLSIIGLATYTYFKRKYWLIGPFYNSWIVMLLPVMGYFCITGCNLSCLGRSRLLLLAMMSLFAYCVFVVIGYLKDISADRETHYNTFPVIHGWNKTVLLGDVLLVISFFLCYYLIRPINNLTFALLLLCVIVAASGQLFLHFTRLKQEDNTSYSIISTVRTFILLHLMVVVNYREDWLVFVLFYYVCFEVALHLRPEKHQV